MAPVPGPGRRALLVPLAFAALYLVWGSTYLAIRFAVESMPPFLMAAARFVISGAILYGWSRWRGAPSPTGRQWRSTAIIGTLLLLGGNGIVSWAEQWVPSGLAALLVATMPLWMAAFAWVSEPASRPTPRALAGLVLGFGGVALLVRPGGQLAADPTILVGGLAIVVASALWASGSLYSRRADVPSSPWLSTAMQMLAGSVALALTGTFVGEWGRLDLTAVTGRSWLAFGYLVTFGSFVAFSSYVWLLRVSTPAKVSTYAYVNPVVAVGLGWLLAEEVITAMTGLATAVIVVAVAMITTVRSVPAAGPAPTRRSTTPPSPDAPPTGPARPGSPPPSEPSAYLPTESTPSPRR